jgi:polyisoprenoid-binding protein YceI
MRYVIDASASKLTVRVFATGMLSSLGHNPIFAVRKFEGELELNEQAGGSARLTLDSTSLELQGDVSGRDRWDIVHIMEDDVLEVAAYPTITYEASAGRTTIKPAGTNQYEVGLTGELTLHGTTRTQPINTRVLLHGDMLRASGEVPIQQPDYNLKPVKVPGSMMKVKDEVKLTFDIVARK